MSKGDFPALRMIVDGGKLSPATPFDSERLSSYRRGTVVFCRFTEEKDRVLVRKWFAIIGLVLKQCETPWKNKDEAHEAIKLALGIVNLSKTVSGQWMQYPKSLSDLEDPEMQEALEQMIALLSRMTGVDVDTLRKEASDVGNAIDNSEPAAASPHAPAEAGDAALSPDAADGASESPPASSSAATITACAREMLAMAGLSYQSTKERDEAMQQCLEQWAERLPGMEAHMDDISVAAGIVAGKQRTPAQARVWLAERLGTTVEEIGGQVDG